MGSCLGRSSESDNDSHRKSKCFTCCWSPNSESSAHCCSTLCFRWGKRSSGLIDVSRSPGRSTQWGGHSPPLQPPQQQTTTTNDPHTHPGDPTTLLQAVTPQIVNELVLQTLVLLRTLVGKWVDSHFPSLKLLVVNWIGFNLTVIRKLQFPWFVSTTLRSMRMVGSW